MYVSLIFAVIFHVTWVSTSAEGPPFKIFASGTQIPGYITALNSFRFNNTLY